MKYCKFLSELGPRWGLVESVAGRESITRILSGRGDNPSFISEGRAVDAMLLDDVHLVAPLVPTAKIICVGRNYREHAKELGNQPPTEPLLFMKPPSALIGARELIVRPNLSDRVDFEGELGVLIGKTCTRLRDSDDAREFIAGYTCVNDVTARDLQQKDGQWTRAKGFDTFCPVGPVVVTSEEIDPWAGVDVETRLNREVKQQGNTRDFIFPLDVVVRYISQVMTLFPGDLISTGTPSGVGPMRHGDTVEVEVAGIGILSNKVVSESTPQ